MLRLIPVLAIFALASNAQAAERGLALFHDYIQPLFKKHCYECHSHEAKKAKGGLVLDSRNAILTGGDLGPALIPGKPEESLLLEAISYHNAELQMPPDGKLGDRDFEYVREWIALGAPDPRLPPKGAVLSKKAGRKPASSGPCKPSPPHLPKSASTR